jgi:hypothetical protein
MQDRPPLQMRTITCNNEAVPWKRNNHVSGTRLLLSSDDSNNKFGMRTRTEIVTSQATHVTGTVCAYILLPALILYLFKVNTYVYTPRMAEDGLYLLCLFPQCVLDSRINLLSLPFVP